MVGRQTHQLEASGFDQSAQTHPTNVAQYEQALLIKCSLSLELRDACLVLFIFCVFISVFTLSPLQIKPGTEAAQLIQLL